ncbi:MAG: ankyrin repeat domain-containing protein [Acidobacteriota bacterium]|nr:ankyrin repeat domain-containing protein [Acidobacteriota bacterium]
MTPARLHPYLLVLLLGAVACGESAVSQGEGGAAAPVVLPEPDPDGVTVYRWADVYAAGRLDWAWAIAVDHGNLEQVERLLADGVDPDVLIGGDYQRSSEPRRYGRTALMEAAWSGHEELARRLLAAGADPLAREIEEEERFSGDTALHKAASRGRAGIVRLLLDAGVPVDLEGQGGATALRCAAGDLETFRLLSERGADLAKAGGATQLLDGVASSRATDMAALLLSLGADVEGDPGKRAYGYTPLWSAAVGGHEEMVLFLLEHGADPGVEPYGGDLVALTREAGHEAAAALIERARAGQPLRPPAEDPAQR